MGSMALLSLPLFALVLNPVAILVTLLVFGIIFWAARALLSAFGIGDPIATVVYVILVVVVLLYLISLLGGTGGIRIG